MAKDGWALRLWRSCWHGPGAHDTDTQIHGAKKGCKHISISGSSFVVSLCWVPISIYILHYLTLPYMILLILHYLTLPYIILLILLFSIVFFLCFSRPNHCWTESCYVGLWFNWWNLGEIQPQPPSFFRNSGGTHRDRAGGTGQGIWQLRARGESSGQGISPETGGEFTCYRNMAFKLFQAAVWWESHDEHLRFTTCYNHCLKMDDKEKLGVSSIHFLDSKTHCHHRGAYYSFVNFSWDFFLFGTVDISWPWDS